MIFDSYFNSDSSKSSWSKAAHSSRIHGDDVMCDIISGMTIRDLSTIHTSEALACQYLYHVNEIQSDTDEEIVIKLVKDAIRTRTDELKEFSHEYLKKYIFEIFEVSSPFCGCRLEESDISLLNSAISYFKENKNEHAINKLNALVHIRKNDRIRCDCHDTSRYVKKVLAVNSDLPTLLLLAQWYIEVSIRK